LEDKVTSGVSSQTGFQERPIRYVLLAEYMFTGGAEVSWFSSAQKPSADLSVSLDALGTRVYDQGGVMIWQLN
jgi:hypothetical protein